VCFCSYALCVFHIGVSKEMLDAYIVLNDAYTGIAILRLSLWLKRYSKYQTEVCVLLAA